jgi:hypothetical protein
MMDGKVKLVALQVYQLLGCVKKYRTLLPQNDKRIGSRNDKEVDIDPYSLSTEW